MKEKILFTWLGNNDLNDTKRNHESKLGALASILFDSNLNFNKVVILTNRKNKEVEEYDLWLKKKIEHHKKITKIDIIFCLDNTNPTDYAFIYQNCEAAIKTYDDQDYDLYFNITSGTSAMSATWLLLGTSVFQAKLIQSSKERGIEFIDLPYDISLKNKQDKKLQILSGKKIYSEEFSEISATSNQMNRIIKIADLIAPRNVPVIIQGETGTGKEVLARAIHNASPRKNKPFIAVNCGAISSGLIDSELFGHKKGSFTGADQDRCGHFESAHGGTLFLDELGELPLDAQVKLLRVLQQKEIVRLGESKSRKIDVRVIAATHRDLMKMVRLGSFREDLFYRLAIGIIYLPSLRERGDDIAHIATSLMTTINNELKDSNFIEKNLSPNALNFIQQQTWYGNVRELYNTLLRAAIWNPDLNILDEKQISESILGDTQISNCEGNVIELPVDLPGKITQIKKSYIEAALDKTKQHKSKAAKLLGLNSIQTLDNWLKN